MYAGSCLCGVVKYEVRGAIGGSVCCHCSRCRKASGSAFAINAVVAAKDFVIVDGQASFKCFSTAAGVHRSFCAHCGSPVISRRDSLPDIVRLRLGTLDTPIAHGPEAHIYVGSKAEWFEIRDELPQFQGRR